MKVRQATLTQHEPAGKKRKLAEAVPNCDASQETRISIEDTEYEFATPSPQLQQPRMNTTSDLPGLDQGSETQSDHDLSPPPAERLLPDATSSPHGPGWSSSNPIMIPEEDATPPPSSPPVSPNSAEQLPGRSPGRTNEVRHATSHSCADAVLDEASCSPGTRLRVRQGAYSAALEGRWSDNSLKSTRPRETSVEL